MRLVIVAASMHVTEERATRRRKSILLAESVDGWSGVEGMRSIELGPIKE